MTDHDAREELRRRLDTGEISATDAERALAVLAEQDDQEGDLAVLRASERTAAQQPGGAMSEDEFARVVDSWDIEDAIAATMRRWGLETADS